ncbi:hypothetical protein [Pollutibacter soli]|uniref:hypothetical protein n=1 Tax=Pollutibacter soli TaxID=3034157 RepID=UPI003013C5CC
MELEEWKDLWQQDHKKELSDEQQLKNMLSAKSKSPVAIMKRNLLIELWLVVFTYGASILFYFTAWKGRMSEVGWFMLVIALVFVIYYYRKNRLLNRMVSPEGQVLQNLRNQIHTLEKFVGFYLLAGTILVPISMVFFGWIFYWNARYINPGNILFPSPENPWWKVVLIWGILIVIGTFVLGILNKWYVRKLYGRHIAKLREIVHEIESEETELHSG